MSIVNAWRLSVLCAVFLLLTACGGGSGGASVISSNTQQLSGVAATGAAVRGVVSLKDVASGAMQSTRTDNGSYTFNVTGLAGPFILHVKSDDNTVELYSVVRKGGASTRANINPLTTLIVMRMASQILFQSTDPEAIYNNPANFLDLNDIEYEEARAWVIDHTSPYFRQSLDAHGVDEGVVNP
ncbi:MAG: hypothetical protein REI12_12750, partial [Pedobacter sp.]|nr:hypothetical protein [Pedobacter sp.]